MDAGGIIQGIAAVGDTVNSVVSSIANFKLQRNQYRYQKNLQKKIFAREDNAVQRRVADLRAAGLSPVLAAGSAANAGPVVSTNAPQITPPPSIQEKIINVMNMMKMKADISKTFAEEKLIQKQQTKTDADTALVHIKAGQAAIDYQNQKDSGMSSNASQFGKMWNDFWASQKTGTVASQYMKDLHDKMMQNSNKKQKLGGSGGW